MCLQYKSFENTVGKGKIAHNEQCLLFPVFSTYFDGLSAIFHQIWNCCLQTLSVWMSLKFVVWEWVKLKRKNTKNLPVIMFGIKSLWPGASSSVILLCGVSNLVWAMSIVTPRTLRTELSHSLIHHFETVPNSNKLQTTTEMWLLKDFMIQIA